MAVKRKHVVNQPLVLDDEVIRFQCNRYIEYLVEMAKMGQRCDLHSMSSLSYSNEEWGQLMQLLGYSVSGYCDLTSVTEVSKDRAWAKMTAMCKRDSKKVIDRG